MISAYRALKAAFRAFARMPLLVFTTFVLISLLGIFSRVAAEWLGAPFPPLLPHDLAANHGSVQDPSILLHSVMELLTNVVRAFFIAPLAVSVHRFALMGEARDKLAFDLSLRDVRFGNWAAATSGVTELLSDGAIFLNLHGATSAIYQILVSFALIFVGSRMSLIFPLVATGAPDPLRASWTLTKHHVARIASVSFITMISTILLLLIIYVPCRIELRTAGQLGWIQSETATKVIESPLPVCLFHVGHRRARRHGLELLLEYQKPDAE
jgi:hypothetical protein